MLAKVAYDEYYNDLPRMMLDLGKTGYTRNAIVYQGRLDVGVQMIGKPFTMEILATKIREILDSAHR
jgi:tRNA U54 and U55 pseudouridine synthase Pus10